jgi:hypothetical protein
MRAHAGVSRANKRLGIAQPESVRQGVKNNDLMTYPQNWHIWADQLHKLGIGDWAASLLEAAGALTLLGAQLIYVSQPILSRAVPQLQTESLAKLLEDPEQAQGFAAFLRKERGV